MRFSLLLGFSTVLVLTQLGCSDDGRKPVFPAKGRVLFKGQPALHAQVSLHPLDAEAKDGPHPTGKVQEDGTFVLTSYAKNDGAPAGEYAVTVDWWLTTVRKGASEGDGPPVNRLPSRYGRPETSGLKVRIASGNNELPVLKLNP